MENMAEFATTLVVIVLIDLVLAGDNAIVIALTARSLPKDQQRRVIVLGTAGAIVLRILATLAVAWILHIPGLLGIGGVLLIWITFKVLLEEKPKDVEPAKNLFQAIWTVVIADLVMGLDNVLAVAGAAHNNYWLVVLGAAISVPIMIWGSKFILGQLEKRPRLIYLGAGVLAWAAGKMITDEPLIAEMFKEAGWLKWGLRALVVLLVILLGGWAKRQNVTCGV